MELRAILFDTFGTVVDWRSSLIADLGAFGARRGIAADWAALADAWRGAYHPSMDRVRRGEAPWTVLDDLHLQSLERLVVAQGIAGLTPDDLAAMNDLWHRLRPWPDSVPGLTRLKRRFIIGPLSNGNTTLLVDMAKNAGLPWDVIMASDVFGHYKPDPETYLGACRLLRAAPGQVMLCAAHNADLLAARALGLKTAFVPRPTEYGPSQVRDFAPAEAWDFIVTGIDDLASQLDC